MTNEPLAQEREKVEQIIREWRRLDSIFPAIWKGVAMLVPIMLIMQPILKFCHVPKDWATQIMLLPMNIYLILFLLPSYFQKRKQFLQNLTEEETAALERASRIAGKSSRRQARQLLKAQQEGQVNTKKELLRASSLTEDSGMLLRAATQRNETPQKELLRAVPNEDKAEEVIQVQEQA